MKRKELSAMTVADLKALARKKSVSLPVAGKKSDIIAVLSEALVAKPAEKKSAVKVKKAVPAKINLLKNAVAAKKNVETKRTVAAKKTVDIKKTAAARKTIAAMETVSGKTKKPAKKTTTQKTAAKKTARIRKAPKAAPVREWKLPPGAEEPLMAQERVEKSKYYTGPLPQTAAVATGELPRGYNEDGIALLSRDPFVAYAYWEATPSRIEREKAWFGWDSKLCVRVYDITGVQFDGRNAIGYFDQEVEDRMGSWYFDFDRPAHSFCADIGLISSEGRFLTIARSNYITMPRNGVSDVIDEEWMLVEEEFWKLYGYPEGFRKGISSPEMQEMLKRRREMEISSPGLFSRERPKRK